jgi:hypothetical protein
VAIKRKYRAIQEERLIFLELIVRLLFFKIHMNMCLSSERLPRFLWDKADVIGDTIKETSCGYIQKIQSDSRGKVNIFGADSTVTFF